MAERHVCIRLAPLVYAALLAVGIPWYWDSDDLRMLWGVPLWVIIAVVASALASLFTAWLFGLPWPDEDDAVE